VINLKLVYICCYICVLFKMFDLQEANTPDVLLFRVLDFSVQSRSKPFPPPPLPKSVTVHTIPCFYGTAPARRWKTKYIDGLILRPFLFLFCGMRSMVYAASLFLLDIRFFFLGFFLVFFFGCFCVSFS